MEALSYCLLVLNASGKLFCVLANSRTSISATQCWLFASEWQTRTSCWRTLHSRSSSRGGRELGHHCRHNSATETVTSLFCLLHSSIDAQPCQQSRPQRTDDNGAHFAGLLFRALRPRMRRFLLLEIVYINRLALAESAKAW